MSNELLDLFKRLAVVVVSASFYEWPGDLLKAALLSRFHAYILSYFVIAFAIHSDLRRYQDQGRQDACGQRHLQAMGVLHG